ncbi:MAG: sigma-54-dependent Fis family transcriptional regulator [Bacteroidetes bacterium]|nr:MAG: sigma-54-dependent Fis family transcriptional regulator [Bacteroidota bacterium]
MAKILVIDDEKSIRNSLKDVLEYEKHEVSLAEDGIQGLEMFKEISYEIVLCDIKMPKMDGMEVLDELMKLSDSTSVIMISGHGTIDTAVEAIKKGAFDYIEKPLDLNRLLITIRNSLDKTTLITETKTLKRKVNKTWEMIGESKAIDKIRQMIDRVAPSDARVLITGDNGTGKELVARWLHEKSNRNTMPFVEVNCAAIPSELIESELFGHEKGSFTSAYKQRKGKFEQANGGTLFLDEIGDMSLSAQAKVLRALQENRINRVGSDKDIRVDVRIIAATNKNIKQEIENKNFREDLYHRISVILIHVPPLNERMEDIPILAEHFNKQIATEYGNKKKKITADAIQELQKINWTGNIREFRNVLERLFILCDNEITGKDVLAFAQPISR